MWGDCYKCYKTTCNITQNLVPLYGGGGGQKGGLIGQMFGVMTYKVFYDTNQITRNMVLVNSGFHM
jgi:hypothetical protein